VTPLADSQHVAMPPKFDLALDALALDAAANGAPVRLGKRRRPAH
jgi:hypothetical protein